MSKKNRLNKDGKVSVTIEFDADIIEYYQSTGDDWKTRINDDLRRFIGLSAH